MKVNIHAHNAEVDEALRTYAEVRILKLDRHIDRIIDARLEFSLEGLHHAEPTRVARLLVRLAGPDVVARVTAPTWTAAVDEVVDKVDEQLRRRKERLKDHKSRLAG